MKRILLLAIPLFALFLSFKSFAEEPLCAYKIGEVWYTLDESGEEMFAPKNLAGIESYSEGFFRVRYFDEKGEEAWGFMNLDGDVEIKPECDFLTDFSEAMAIITRNRGEATYFGFVDTEGEIRIPVVYIDATPFRDGLAYVMEKRQRGYVDSDGEFRIVLPGFVIGNSFSEGLAVAQNNRYKLGYIDREGRMKIDYRFDEAYDFSEGLARVNYNGKFGYINPEGFYQIPSLYNHAKDVSEGRAFVGDSDVRYVPVWGLIDTTGREILPFQFSDCRNFSEGAACVRDGLRWYFIDKEGEKIIDRDFDKALSLKRDLAFVVDEETGFYGYIDRGGEPVITLPKPEIFVDLRFGETIQFDKED